ncbi:MAG: DUF1080 domain-containing protein, partial [Planctomycetaceae bacterium]|nr:DUF1080 domain-containing protein [Planctomycetaceae bacterium]
MSRSLVGIVPVLLGLVAIAAAEDQKLPPISPTEGVVRLCNGKDLSGLYAWVKEGQRNDSKHVFTVHDGVIHVSGEGSGYLATEREYR